MPPERIIYAPRGASEFSQAGIILAGTEELSPIWSQRERERGGAIRAAAALLAPVTPFCFHLLGFAL